MTTPSAAPVASRQTAHPTRGLVGVVVMFAALNTLFLVAALLESPQWIGNTLVVAGIYAMFALEPILFGAWAALGAGSLLKRLVVSLLCLVFLYIAPGYVPKTYSDLRPSEFIAALLMGVAVWIAVTLIFLLFRKLTRFRIQLPADLDQSRVNFSLRELLIAITMLAIILGFGTQLKLDRSELPTNDIFGFDFYISILLFGGSLISLAVLPTAAIPLAILHGRPTRSAILLAIGFWLLASLPISLLFINDSNARSAIIGPMFVMQLIATTVGVILAIWLRWNGLRLVRLPQPAAAEHEPTV